jgi:Transposase DDE domain group 1
VKASVHSWLNRAKGRIQRRLGPKNWSERTTPMFAAQNIQYEAAERISGLAAGGIGAIHLLARQTGLVNLIDDNLHVLKRHLPYHESDHVLNIAYNLLAGGSRIEHLELRRNDEVFLNALGAERIPDPTTEGDFCRRFTETDVLALMESINEARLGVWNRQPARFFAEAVIDADGTIAPTDGECKAGMDFAYNGQCGYHPLLISLANTGEPLYLVNRSGNRPSAEGAAEWLDRAASLCRRAGFKRIRFRGDTDFSQTKYLDEWDRDGAKFTFGIDASPTLKEMAEKLPPFAFRPLVRPPKYEVQTKPRQRPVNVKQQLVIERGFEDLRLEREDVAEVLYTPAACAKPYRLVVLRKTIVHERRQQRLFDEVRWFFYISNEWGKSAAWTVADANGRCNQENLIAQLKGGVKAMALPVDNLVSNWAYMVMASLAWTLKVWAALWLPESGRWAEQHAAEKERLLRMEFSTFTQAMIQIPCQIVRTGGRIVYRLLSWNPWARVLLRLVDELRQPLRC